jgi:type IV pilus assembly protein PilB
MFFRKQHGIPKKELLGQILLKRNLITRDQLKQALKLQKKERGYIGDVLIKHGFIEEKDVMVALVVQCNFPYIAIDQYEIDLRILQLVPKEIACRFHLIPLERVGDVLSVVMANPLDFSAKEELQKLTQCCIAPFIATRIEIDKAINRCYS